MCGIMGYIQKKGMANKDTIMHMIELLKHRGPDDRGIEFVRFNSDYEDCSLGFVRLSIQDLSKAGHQPMWNDDHTICIMFNGEIYNTNDFRNVLKENGYKFRGTSDTEVLLYLYEMYGIDETLKKIDGMFAICIWNSDERSIILARDRIGEKPLYVYENESLFMWASEYKAFYCHPDFKAELEMSNITEYLMFRYICNGGTLLKGVRNLRPGCYYKITGIKREEVIYWSLLHESKMQPKMIDEKEFEKWIKEAVRSRLISDVPIGVQLSGGIDSSVVTKIAADYLGKELNTIGIVFDSKNYNEEAYMEHVSNICDMNLQKVKLNGREFLKNWQETTWFLESPMNHPGSVCLLGLNQRAKETVSVLLCGEGADETLGGYPRFSRYLYYKKHPLIRRIYMKIQREKNGDHDGTKDGKGYIDSFIKETQFVSSTYVNKIYPPANTKHVIAKRRNIFGKRKYSTLRALLDYEINTYLQDILMRVDKISMAASVEVRVPYLMPKLLENERCWNEKQMVSPEFRNMDKIMFSTKIPLKKLASSYFGNEFTYRDKVGLAVDIKYYFLEPNITKYIEEVLLPGIKHRSIFDYSVIEEIWDQVKIQKNSKKGRINDRLEALWVVLSFELWCQMYIDKSPVKWSCSDE